MIDYSNFEIPEQVIEAFCKAYLNTDNLQFAIYAIDIMYRTIEAENKNTGGK
ncbi:hypothetical protein ABFP60_14725 [Clostridioides difficile]